MVHNDEAEELRGALVDLMKQIEIGTLVRNTDGDEQSGWAIKQLPLVMALQRAQRAIESTGGERNGTQSMG